MKEHLTGDAEVYADPEKYFDQVIEIDLSTLSPHINGPFTPDLATPVAEMKERPQPTIGQQVSNGVDRFVYELVLRGYFRACSIAEDALQKALNLSLSSESARSEQVRFTIERDGFIETFNKLRLPFTNACGPCIGQWGRYKDPKNGPKNSIVHSFNRNFAKRADGNPNTHAFVTSPEMVAAIAIARFDVQSDY